MVERVHSFLAARGIPLASNQINYSLMYRKDADATVAKCKELGVPVIAYFPLANGLLSGRYDADNMPPLPGTSPSLLALTNKEIKKTDGGVLLKNPPES